MSKALEICSLSFSYGERRVLEDISFSLEAGQLLSVLGPNGVGKSTLFRCILGLSQGYSGSILINGKNASSMSAREIATQVAYIPQSHYPAFNYSVFEMVLMGTTNRTGLFSSPGKREKEAAMAALEQLGIADLAERSYMRLSGGEQQLVLISRAIAQEAKLLMMDEPTSNLDYGNQHKVMTQVRTLADSGYTVILSTHNPQQALLYAHQVLALKNGKAQAKGSPEDILTQQLLYELYGVEVGLYHTPAGKVILPREGGQSL